MTELINKQKVLDLVRDICIDILDECESYIDVIDGETDRVYKNLNEVNAILKCNKRIRNGVRQLPSESLENSILLEWIPCSERLPEDDGYYLASEENGGIEVEWYDETGWGYFGVLAWAPLPKPWKGEEDEISCR